MTSTFHHERITLPMYHVKYDVFVSPDMNVLREHVETIYPGLQLDVNSSNGGYTAIVVHPTQGNILLVLINSKERPDEMPTIERTIFHECVHLSWYILDGIGLKIDADNHEAQAYLMEELIDNVSRVVRESANPEEDMSDL